MKSNDLAKRLHGMDLSDFPSELNDEAKRSGLVVVIGTSRDNIDFYGAIRVTVDMPEGGAIHIDADGVLPDPSDIDPKDEGDVHAYYDRKRMSYLIDAEFNQHGFAWSFTTVIPHHRFMVFKDGARYCRAIVFEARAIGGK